jgi:hypothetical protein
MAALKLLVMIFLLSPCVNAQVTLSIKQPKDKKILEFPIREITKVTTYAERKANSESIESMYISFFSDKSVPVRCIHDSKIFEVAKVDSIYIVITSFDKYFLTYSGLTKPKFKKGDIIKAGQAIAYLKKDYDDRYCVDIYYSNEIRDLDPAPLFGK